VGAQVQAAPLAARHRIDKGIEVVAAVHPVERAVVHGLQSQLQTNVAVASVFFYQVENWIGHVVRPRADGQADDLRMIEGFVIKFAELLKWSVRVGRGLEISDELLGTVAIL